MAEIIRRVWRTGPRKVKRVSWGYTLQVAGKQVRRFNSAWTEDDAQKALAAAVLDRDASASAERATITFGQAVEKYLGVKTSEGKRSLHGDRANLGRLMDVFGADTPLPAITAAGIADYKVARMAAEVRRHGAARTIAPATLNRDLATLRHLLRLAVDEWQVIDKRPRIKLLKESEGRMRWLEADEEARLVAACRASKAPYLAGIVTVALESGLRRGELLGLTWDRVDLSRGVLRLEITKSGRRREVPMRQAVYAVLTELPGPREGRVWPRARDIRKGFVNAVETARLGDFRFHDLRHHFASWFMMRGGSLQALKEILGHRDLKMTLRYAHLAPDHLRSEMEKTERSAHRQHIETERAEGAHASARHF